MQRTLGSGPHTSRLKAGPARFARLSGQDSSTVDLLHGCAVVTANGEKIGTVDYLMVDVLTQQLRYVVLSRKKSSALVTIPWHTLYFDAALSRLVFYTLC
jgi:hypothetical protein